MNFAQIIYKPQGYHSRTPLLSRVCHFHNNCCRPKGKSNESTASRCSSSYLSAYFNRNRNRSSDQKWEIQIIHFLTFYLSYPCLWQLHPNLKGLHYMGDTFILSIFLGLLITKRLIILEKLSSAISLSSFSGLLWLPCKLVRCTSTRHWSFEAI